MNKKYWVFVREVHIRPLRVTADSPAEAISVTKQNLVDKYFEFDPKDIGELEFCYTMEPVTWNAEEEK